MLIQCDRVEFDGYFKRIELQGHNRDEVKVVRDVFNPDKTVFHFVLNQSN